jgi:hypothetical protein
MLVSCYQKTGQKHTIEIRNKFSEDGARFKDVEAILMDQNCMQKEI